MRRIRKEIISYLCLSFFVCFYASCSKDHPGTSKNDNGEDSPFSNVSLKVNFSLDWLNIPYNVDLSTKATNANPHRFVFEIASSGQTVCRDIVYLNDYDFDKGTLNHTLSKDLYAKNYEVAVWYDYKSDDGYSFDVASLQQVKLIRFSTTDAESYQCGYASTILDLRNYEGSSVSTNLEMKIPGARFEIVATDVLQFITENKEALNQGDKFTANISLTSGGFSDFNAFSGNVVSSSQSLNLSGRMRLPFDDYTELKIAEGFFFCQGDSEISAVLSISNSALATISQTENFSFPAKPGCITTVSGDFLTHPIDGVFNIDNVWGGEIYHEVE